MTPWRGGVHEPGGTDRSADERGLAASGLACLDRCVALLDGDDEILRPLWAALAEGSDAEEWGDPAGTGAGEAGHRRAPSPAPAGSGAEGEAVLLARRMLAAAPATGPPPRYVSGPTPVRSPRCGSTGCSTPPPQAPCLGRRPPGGPYGGHVSPRRGRTAPPDHGAGTARRARSRWPAAGARGVHGGPARPARGGVAAGARTGLTPGTRSCGLPVAVPGWTWGVRGGPVAIPVSRRKGVTPVATCTLSLTVTAHRAAHRAPERTMRPQAAAKPVRWAADTVSTMREGARLRLDYSTQSLWRVDRMIEELRREQTPYAAVESVLRGFGAYAGEVIVRQAGAPPSGSRRTAGTGSVRSTGSCGTRSTRPAAVSAATVRCGCCAWTRRRSRSVPDAEVRTAGSRPTRPRSGRGS